VSRRYASHQSARGGPVDITIANFKGIASATLPDVRLTIVAGSNSSGKSSLLQALLFLAQSWGQPAPVINGDLVRLGEAQDVLRNGTEQMMFRFGFSEAYPDAEEARVVVEVVLRADGHALRSAEYALLVDDRVVLRARDRGCNRTLEKMLNSNETALQIEDTQAPAPLPEAYLTVYGLQPGRLVSRASEPAYREVFEQLLRSGPTAIFVLDELARTSQADDLPAHLRQRLTELRHGRYSGIDPQLLDLAPDEQEALFRLFFRNEAPNGWASDSITLGSFGRTLPGFSPGGLRPPGHGTPVPEATARLTGAVRRIEAFAGSVLYLGPLRDDPRVAYPLGHTVRNLPVGEKGEFTAAYLEQHGARRITYTDPAGRRRVAIPLLDAVSEWSNYLGIADTVDVESRGKLGHELRLKIHGRDRDPTAVGVGASQLLPVIVLVLGADAGDFALLEQPELHLHPKVQSRLADFFATARPDVRALVETHSEYLVTRLRLRIAQEGVDPSNVAVLFAAQEVEERVYVVDDEEVVEAEAVSVFRHLAMTETGDFTSWPKDFFDTLGDDNVELARAIAARLRAAE
jgi:predicted ATPase